MPQAGNQIAPDTRTRILNVSERLVQERGFNGFSYADVASELQITTASLHYHFAGKAELGRALIARYESRFTAALDLITAEQMDAPGSLLAYANLYATVLGEGRMCLCGMLAAEYSTLPEPMKEAVIGFFDHNEAWLGRLLAKGQTRGTLRFSGSPEESARMIISALEGAMLVARPYENVSRFHSTAQRLIESLITPARNS